MAVSRGPQLTMTMAWAVWCATREPGREPGLNEFAKTAARIDDRTVDVPLREEGKFGRVLADDDGVRVGLMDGDEFVRMPLDDEEVKKWLKRVGCRSVSVTETEQVRP